MSKTHYNKHKLLGNIIHDGREYMASSLTLIYIKLQKKNQFESNIVEITILTDLKCKSNIKWDL